MNIPTFEEWYFEKYGDSFENLHQRPQDIVFISMKLLSKELAQYTYEILQLEVTK